MVFGNLYEEKNTTDKFGEASYRLFVTFLPEKQRLSPAKNFNSPRVCDENKSPQRSALRTETSVNFPPENSLRPAIEGVTGGHRGNTDVIIIMSTITPL